MCKPVKIQNRKKAFTLKILKLNYTKNMLLAEENLDLYVTGERILHVPSSKLK